MSIDLASLASRISLCPRRRQREIKRAAFPSLGLHPDPPTMALDDFLGDRQTDAGAGILVSAMQALEDQEDPLGKLRLDADAVVPHPQEPILPPACRANRDLYRFVPAEF